MITVMKHEATSGSDGYVHYLDCSNGFMVVYMLKFMWLYTINMHNLLYVNYSPKTKKKINSYVNFPQCFI